MLSNATLFFEGKQFLLFSPLFFVGCIFASVSSQSTAHCEESEESTPLQFRCLLCAPVSHFLSLVLWSFFARLFFCPIFFPPSLEAFFHRSFFWGRVNAKLTRAAPELSLSLFCSLVSSFWGLLCGELAPEKWLPMGVWAIPRPYI